MVESSSLSDWSVLTDDSKQFLQELPSNWARLLEKVPRPKSNNVTHTRVAKAQAHLELLQNVIDEWLFEQHRLANQSVSNGRSVSQHDLQSSISDGLEIVGSGLHVRDEEEFIDIPSLGADEVIDEAVQLLGRLERERAELEEQIVVERRRVAMLAEKIEKMAYLRMMELGAAVQREHLASVSILTELQWHLNARTKELEAARKRYNKSKIAQDKLNEKLEFLEAQRPLIQEKIQLEMSSLDNIKKAQEETSKNLDETERHMQEISKQHAKEFAEAKIERDQMASEVAYCRELYETARINYENSLQEAAKLQDDINNTRQEIETNRQYIKDLKDSYGDKLKYWEELKADVEKLRKELAVLMKIQADIQKENQAYLDYQNSLRQTQENNLQTRQSEIDKSEDDLKLLKRNNKEFEMEIGDIKAKIRSCQSQTQKDRESMERMHEEFQQLEKDMISCNEELARVQILFDEVSARLNEKEQSTRKKENSLNNQLKELTKAKNQEIITRETMLSDISEDTKDLTNFKKIAAEQRSRMSQVEAEIEKEMAEIKSIVTNLRKDDEKWRTIKEKNQSALYAVLEEKRRHESHLRGQMEELQPIHKTKSDNLEKLNKRLDYIAANSRRMNEKLDEILGAASMIAKNTIKVESEIRLLDSENSELNVVLQSHLREETGYKEKNQTAETKFHECDSDHDKFLRHRQTVLKSLQAQVKEASSNNVTLAKRYRSVQNEYYDFKEKFIDFRNAILIVNYNIKDVKQVQKLQCQMSHALLIYFRLKEAFNRGKYLTLEDECVESGLTVKELHNQMASATQKIKDFLHDEMRYVLSH